MSLSPDLDRLQAYLDGRLGPAELRRLEGDLKADPDLCAALVRLAREDAVLAEWARAARAAGDWADAASPARPTQSWIRRSARTWIGLSAALTGLAAALVLVAWHAERGSRQVPLGQLKEVHGEVIVVNPAGDEFAASSGQNLYPGQRLRTGDGSHAVLQYGSTTRFELGAETILWLTPHGTQPDSVRLEEGQLTGDFVNQPEGNPMLVQTPHAEVRASGSRINFSSAAGSTRVDPEEGTIQVTRTSDGQSIRVPSGSYAVAAPDAGPFAPRPLPKKFVAPRHTLTHQGFGPIQVCAVSRDGKTLATCGADGLVNLWDLPTRSVRLPFNPPARPIRALCFSPKGKWLAATTDEKDRPVHVWEVASGREVCSLGGPKMKVSALAFAPNGAILVTVGGGKLGGEVRLWDTETWKELKPFAGHKAEVQAVAFSADGDYLATGTADGQVRLWDLDGVVLRTLEGHTQNVRALTFRPDGEVLVSGGRDGRVNLWDVETGKAIRTLNHHTGEVRGLAFDSEGRVLATCGADHTVLLYNGGDDHRLVSFLREKQPVSWVGFSPNGRTLTLLTVGADRTIKLWDLGEDEPAAKPQT